MLRRLRIHCFPFTSSSTPDLLGRQHPGQEQELAGLRDGDRQRLDAADQPRGGSSPRPRRRRSRSRPGRRLGRVRGGLRDVGRLLARFVAADVDAVGEDAGLLLEHRPRVPRGRDLFELRLRHRRPRRDPAVPRGRPRGASVRRPEIAGAEAVAGAVRSSRRQRCSSTGTASRGRSSARSERPAGIAFSSTATISTTESFPASKPSGTEIVPSPRSSGRTGTPSTLADHRVAAAGSVRSRAVPIAPGRRVIRSRCRRVPSRVSSVVVSRRLATAGRLGAAGSGETASRRPAGAPVSRQAAASPDFSPSIWKGLSPSGISVVLGSTYTVQGETAL